MNNYTACVELTQDGQNIVLYFQNLTMRQAQTLNLLMHKNYSDKFSTAEVQRYGWEAGK